MIFGKDTGIVRCYARNDGLPFWWSVILTSRSSATVIFATREAVSPTEPAGDKDPSCLFFPRTVLSFGCARISLPVGTPLIGGQWTLIQMTRSIPSQKLHWSWTPWLQKAYRKKMR
jgi:hypothetical protein